ncbi:tetratricopeptide repeat protein [Thauera sp. Sel9]|uniref:tetratricopeptide repeat protein n=1 Tax=Thauera sp. Sel9 TaxID=2974299 RepID=UPI0021E178DB|nr:tetratricopeptide repeat protein [Thauera sp. Sel9]MCV2217978.1 sel1 repeat family protein [Thauera sp. Sel9]
MSRWRSHTEKVDNPDKRPYRCEACSHRFIASADAAMKKSRTGGSSLLTIGAAAVVAGAVSSVVLLWPDAAEHDEAAINFPQAAIAVNSTIEEAARNGDVEAQFRLGRAALLDTSRGKEGAAEAVTWLRQAATGGHAGAMLQLGKLYRSGVGMPQNYDYAEKWIRTAAEAGDSDAMVELGRLYRSGLGVTVNPVQAYVWFNRAAAAMNMDGVYERDNIALKLGPDEMKAAQALSLADEEGHVDPTPDKVASED